MQIMSDKRLDSERIFHDNRFADADHLRANIKKYYIINKIALKKYYNLISATCKNKHLLEYGCGVGDNIKKFKDLGAHVTGIDISQEGIKQAKERSSTNNLDANLLVMDVENTGFKNDEFDIIVGQGIIHHLNLKKIYSETSRLLNANGHAIFLEPLGHNPIINLYRKLTPNIRTSDEHPLMKQDLKLLKKYFYNVNIEYFSLLTLLTVPFRNSLIFKPLFTIFSTIDKQILKIPIIREWAWIVIIHIHKPIKQNI